MTCRKFMGDIETGGAIHPRDEPGGNLPTAQAVSGIKVARAWSRRWCGTWEPIASMLSSRAMGGKPPGCRKGGRQGAEPPRRRTPKAQSTDARHGGGLPRSSDKAR